MKFAVIGCGNVAWHYSKMWMQAGHECLFGFSRNDEHFTEKMTPLGISYVPMTHWPEQPDAVLIAVPDDQILQVAQSIDPKITVIIPSGSFDIHALRHPKKMVIWGIYSFLHGKEMDYNLVPFCVEACDDVAKNQLQALMAPWAGQIHLTSQVQRTKAHMAAVFANNFVSTLYTIAFDILEQEDLPPALLVATIQQLAEKVKTETPNHLQTGPAKRNDLQTLQKHLLLLNDQPEQQEIYRLLSNYILTKYGHSKL
jgi:predicted short-subunit dehydrogenase-like oxidoreductase (DUF2520 family)